MTGSCDLVAMILRDVDSLDFALLLCLPALMATASMFSLLQAKQLLSNHNLDLKACFPKSSLPLMVLVIAIERGWPTVLVSSLAICSESDCP